MNDALIEAEQLLEQLPDAVSRRALGERLGWALQELRTAGHQIERIAALIGTAGLIDFGKQPLQRATLQDMIESADGVGESLVEANDAEALRSAVYEYTSDLTRAIASLDRAIREHWRVIASERFQPMIGLGHLLASMNLPNDLGARLVACGKAATAMSTTGSAPDLQTAIATLLADYDQLQSERAAEIGDDEVGEFVNALADKRATLAMVTDKVRQWLAEHRALERLGVMTL